MKTQPPNKHKLDEWIRWVDRIETDLIHLLGSRQIYKRYIEIVQANDKVRRQGTIFHDWVIHNYVTYVAMSIRRQLDENGDVISLAKLIREIKVNPENVTKEWHRTLYTNSLAIEHGIPDSTFEHCAGKGESFDSRIAEADLQDLLKLSQNIRKLANREVAHRSKNKSPTKVTFQEVDDCINKLKELARKYILLFTAASNEMEPAILDNWESIFNRPWFQHNKQ
jgi:hypothetical protein